MPVPFSVIPAITTVAPYATKIGVETVALGKAAAPAVIKGGHIAAIFAIEGAHLIGRTLKSNIKVHIDKKNGKYDIDVNHEFDKKIKTPSFKKTNKRSH